MILIIELMEAQGVYVLILDIALTSVFFCRLGWRLSQTAWILAGGTYSTYQVLISFFFFSHAAISLIGGEGERKCWVGGWGVHAAVIPRWRCGSLSLFRVYPQRIIYDRPRLHLVFHPSPGKARVAVRIGSLLRPRPPSSTSRRTPPRRRGVASGAATRWSPWGARRSPCASAAVSARLCPRSAWFPSPHRKPWPEG